MCPFFQVRSAQKLNQIFTSNSKKKINSNSRKVRLHLHTHTRTHFYTPIIIRSLFCIMIICKMFALCLQKKRIELNGCEWVPKFRHSPIIWLWLLAFELLSKKRKEKHRDTNERREAMLLKSFPFSLKINAFFNLLELKIPRLFVLSQRGDKQQQQQQKHRLLSVFYLMSSR